MKQSIIILMGTICFYANGQQSVNSVGGNVEGNSGSVSYSVGQISTNFNQGGFQLNEGVQQPYEFFEVLSIEKLSEGEQFKIFPNPTSGIINLSSSTYGDANLEVLDEAGRLIWKQSYTNILTTSIDLTEYSRGSYVIRVVGDSSTQIIKIIKN